MDPEPIITPPLPREASAKWDRPSIFLSLFAFLLLLSTAFLSYQNMQLKKLLNAPTNYEECLVSAGSVLQESYPATCVSASGARFTQPLTEEEQQKLIPPTDETANWKMYSSEKYYVQFKYPNDIPVEINQADSANSIQFIFAKSAPSSFTIKASTKYPPNQSKYLNDTEPSEVREIFGQKWNAYMLSADDGLQLEKNNVLYSIIYPNSREKLVYQILSTFKFIDQNVVTPTCTPRPACLDSTPRCMIPETEDMCPPVAKACTMEAKLCPDGSYVGRTGPNCEFTPCP